MRLRDSMRLAWSYGLVVLVLALTWVVASVALGDARSSLESIVIDENSLSLHVSGMSTALVDQETGLRGYLLTGDAQFLQPYHAGRTELEANRVFAAQAVNDSRETRYFDLAFQRAHDWEIWAQKRLQSYRIGERGHAANVREELQGKRLSARFQSAIDDLERRLLSDNLSTLDASRRTFGLAESLLAALVIGTISVVGLLGWRNVRLFLAERGARKAAEDAERALRVSGERYRSLVETSPDGVFLARLDGTIVLSNERGATLFGYRNPEALQGFHLLDFVVPEDEERAKVDLRKRTDLKDVGGWTHDYQWLRQDGSAFAAEASISVLREADGEAEYITIVVRDVTERKSFEDQLRRQALHDPLTDLPNRTLLTDRIDQAMTTARWNGRQFAVLLMDLDRFKEINDTFGHAHGDILLREAGDRVRRALRGSDTVARLGGDEFAIVLPGSDATGASSAAHKIREALSERYVLEGEFFEMQASIGIALYPAHGRDTDTLLRRADVAMYLAKQTDGGYAVYSPDEDHYSPSRLALVGELRHGIEEGQLRLHYQPKVNLRTGEADSVEALVRWEHPQHGLMAPDRFIPVAERTGLIHALTEWVIDQALRQCHAWAENGTAVRVAVNLSARSLHNPGVEAMIVRLLTRWSVHPSCLELELTENAIMSDPVRATEVLSRLHARGIRLSIDDFGTGYSSLAYLKRLPVDQIKIDRSFVMDMATDENDRSIVKATIALGHELGLETVAEGVEDPAIWEMLEGLHCDSVQGYLLSPPVPAEECTAWLNEWRLKAAA